MILKTHRETKLRMFNLTKKYIKSNYIMFSVGIYFLFSTLLNVLTGINICIPCIWKTVFNISCPGCGLTTAFMDLLKLDIRHAFKMNWLIFVILPFGLYYLIKDFKRFKKKYYCQQKNWQE